MSPGILRKRQQSSRYKHSAACIDGAGVSAEQVHVEQAPNAFVSRGRFRSPPGEVTIPLIFERGGIKWREAVPLS